MKRKKVVVVAADSAAVLQSVMEVLSYLKQEDGVECRRFYPLELCDCYFAVEQSCF